MNFARLYSVYRASGSLSITYSAICLLLRGLIELTQFQPGAFAVPWEQIVVAMTQPQ